MFSKVIKTTLTSAILLTSSSFLSTGALAEEDLVAKKMEDAVVFQMVFLNFHTGKGERAEELIKKHFNPASKKAGTETAWVMHMNTGKWNSILFWTLEGGFADLDWQTSPDGVKFVTALRELEGGKDKADALFKEWRSLIKDRDRALGHHHLDADEKAARDKEKK